MARRARDWFERLSWADVLIGVGLVLTTVLTVPVSSLAAGSRGERGRFACPARASTRPPQVDAESVLSTALARGQDAVEAAEFVDTSKAPGVAGIVAGVVRNEGGGEAVIVPMLTCDDSACAGAPLRFRGARDVRVRAVIDLAGYDGDLHVDGESGPPGPMWGGCPRRPAFVVEVIDGPERGADRLLMIVTLSSAELRVIHSERSHIGPEGGSTVVALRFRGTRGGSPSDLVVLRRREARGASGSAVVREHLFNYVDGRYQSAP